MKVAFGNIHLPSAGIMMKKVALLFLVVLEITTVWTAKSGRGKAPQIRPARLLLKAAPGVNTYMACEATGVPKPSISWERDGVPIQKYGSRFSINKKSQALIVYKLQLADRGNYTCIAKNRMGMDSITIELRVLVQPEAKIIAPSNFTFMELTSHELVCRSRGIPRPKFEWHTSHHQRIRHSSTGTTNSSTPKRLFTRERQVDEEVYESVLMMQPVTYEDLGTFACMATNDVGSSKDRVSLDVRFPPKILSVHDPTSPVIWWEGHSTNLTCVVVANDHPNIMWTRNGQPYTCEDDKVVGGKSKSSETTFTCTIKHRKHGGEGNYTCSAYNSLGSIFVHEFRVKEIYPPPPVDFYPVSVKLHEVEILVIVPHREDTPPSSYVFASYRAAVHTIDGQFGPEYERVGEVNEQGEATVRLVGVRNNSNYTVEVRAKNLAGLGSPTTKIISTALPATTSPPLTRKTSARPRTRRPQDTNTLVDYNISGPSGSSLESAASSQNRDNAPRVITGERADTSTRNGKGFGDNNSVLSWHTHFFNETVLLFYSLFILILFFH